MPLYTFVAVYRGQTFVAQDRHSNPKGFTHSWVNAVASYAKPPLSKPLIQELAHKGIRAEFMEVPNRKNVWMRTFELDGGPFVVYAVQTVP